MQQLLACLLRARSCYYSYDKNVCDTSLFGAHNRIGNLTGTLLYQSHVFFLWNILQLSKEFSTNSQTSLKPSSYIQMKLETWLRACSHQREKNFNSHVQGKLSAPSHPVKAPLCTFPLLWETTGCSENQPEVVLNTLSDERCQNQLSGRERIYESCLGFGMNRC